MITIKDIAKEAQVSEGTVDRVLHNRGGVSKRTEAKIKDILKKHNYSINPVASALASKNKYTIAVLIPEHSDSDIFWKSPYMGILKASNEFNSFGIQVTVYRFDQYDSSSYTSKFKSMLHSNPSMALIVPLFINETELMITELKDSNIPYVFMNIDLEGFNNIAFTGQDAYTAGYIAAKLMHSGGQSDAKYLIVYSEHNLTVNNTVLRRIKGFKDYFESQELYDAPLSLRVDDFSHMDATADTVNTFLSDHPSIHGIFVPSSRINRIVDCIDPLVLKKYKLIGFDNTPPNIACLENETVSFLISQKPFDQGYESIQLMADYLIKKKIPHGKIYLPIDILTKENVRYNDRNALQFEVEHL